MRLFMSEYDVIVYGTIALDAIWRVQELPAPGGYAPILEQREMIGGEACNTAIALTRWGVRVALVGNAIGNDEHGSLLRELLARDAPDLDTRYIRTLPDAQTPYCVCIATPDGERTMYGTSFHDWQCAVLDPDLARSARFFTMEPNAWEAGRQAAQIAASAGASVVAMDYTRDPGINRIAAINLTSHTELPGSTSWQEWSDYAFDLRGTYGPTAIVTCGPQGCLVAEAGKTGKAVHVPAYVAPVMVDGTGCGDVFRAGLIYGQLQEWELLRSVRFASAAAALNCGAMGGWGGVRSVSEIEVFQREG
jgi:sulfofructose kinase